MGVEVRPLGVKCNITCLYCYQNPIRDAGNAISPYNMAAMKAAIAKEGSSFTLFGGEPLLVSLSDLEELWRFGLERFGGNGIQTNGTLITDAHITLFTKYKVHVGISIDGPGELNELRWSSSSSQTADLTQRTESAIAKLCRIGHVPSLIITLSKCNGVGERLDRLLAWVSDLDDMGVYSARLHTLEIDLPEIRSKYALSIPEYIHAFEQFEALEGRLTKLRFDVFQDMRKMLLGEDENVTCVWGACDPYTTRAVRGIEGNGQASNCGRTNKEGVEYIKADRPGFERQIALYATPQSVGGCNGCRYFLMCKGECPGTAIDGDWRNRSAECSLWYSLFDRLEAQLLASGQKPISSDPQLSQVLETSMLRAWSSGDNPTIASEIRRMKLGEASTLDLVQGGVGGHGDLHGDHWDERKGRDHEDEAAHHADGASHHVPFTPPHADHGDYSSRVERVYSSMVPPEEGHGDHGDHGDSHGDHVDDGKRKEHRDHGDDGRERDHGDHGDHGDAHRDHDDENRLAEHGDHTDHGDAHRDHDDENRHAEHGDHTDHGDDHGDSALPSAFASLRKQAPPEERIVPATVDPQQTATRLEPKSHVRHLDDHGDHSDSITGSEMW